MDNQQWRAAHVSYQLPPLLSTLGAYLRISTHARYLHSTQSMSASNPAFSPAAILWASVSNVPNQYHSGPTFPALIQDEHNEHGWVSSLSSLQLSSSASVKTRQKTCTDAHQPGIYLCYELVTNDVITLTQSKSRKWMSSRARVCLQLTWFNSPRSKIKSTWAQQLSNSGVVMRSKHVNMDESWHLADTITLVF